MTEPCDHRWQYQQELTQADIGNGKVDIRTSRSLAQNHDYGNANVRTCLYCKLEERKAWHPPLSSPLLGCRTMAELVEVATILEDLRQVEGREIRLICDNPDFEGPNTIVTMDWDWELQGASYSGDSVLACLRAALADKEKNSG